MPCSSISFQFAPSALVNYADAWRLPMCHSIILLKNQSKCGYLKKIVFVLMPRGKLFVSFYTCCVQLAVLHLVARSDMTEVLLNAVVVVDGGAAGLLSASCWHTDIYSDWSVSLVARQHVLSHPRPSKPAAHQPNVGCLPLLVVVVAAAAVNV